VSPNRPRNGAPLDTDALLRAAHAHHRGGRSEEAALCCETVLAAAPDHPEALHMLGMLRVMRGDSGSGIRLLRHAAEVAPKSDIIWYNLGIALHDQRRGDEALECFRRVLECEPRDAARLDRIGMLFGDAGRLDDAVECFRRAVALDPEFAAAHGNLGIVLQRLGRPGEAVASFQRAAALRPDDATLFRLGVALAQQNRFDEAIDCYRAVLALQPDAARAHYNLGNALGGLHRPEEALASFTRALELEPDLAEAHWNAALLRLLKGDFPNGWRDYEWRWRAGVQPAPRDYGDRPRWSGEQPLNGRRILVHAEQGFGDTLQFVRYANLLANRGATVFLEAPVALTSLLADMRGIGGVIAEGEALPPFDFHIPLMSLPLAFGTTLETIPAQVPYLAPPPPSRVAAWRARLPADGKRRIGIAWSGARPDGNDHGRSMPLAALAPILASPGCRFVVVQTDRADDDGLPELIDLRSQITDFADTAAILAGLDLVITIDTAVAHLAGAMARPVWIMLPYAPAWRWLLGRDDCPWYPTARLFRQLRPGDWSDVVERVRAALGRVDST
jgi:tetratricopeptide (TPR) repeat protein